MEHIKNDEKDFKFNAYAKLPNGDESWYDKDGKIIRTKKFIKSENCFLVEKFIYNELTKIEKYDKNERLIYIKSLHPTEKDFEKWYEYDEKGNLIHYKDTANHEHWLKYNENNNLIHKMENNGFQEWYEYDENNQIKNYYNSDDYPFPVQNIKEDEDNENDVIQEKSSFKNILAIAEVIRKIFRKYNF